MADETPQNASVPRPGRVTAVNVGQINSQSIRSERLEVQRYDIKGDPSQPEVDLLSEINSALGSEKESVKSILSSLREQTREAVFALKMMASQVAGQDQGTPGQSTAPIEKLLEDIRNHIIRARDQSSSDSHLLGKQLETLNDNMLRVASSMEDFRNRMAEISRITNAAPQAPSRLQDSASRAQQADALDGIWQRMAGILDDLKNVITDSTSAVRHLNSRLQQTIAAIQPGGPGPTTPPQPQPPPPTGAAIPGDFFASMRASFESMEKSLTEIRTHTAGAVGRGGGSGGGESAPTDGHFPSLQSLSQAQVRAQLMRDFGELPLGTKWMMRQNPRTGEEERDPAFPKPVRKGNYNIFAIEKFFDAIDRMRTASIVQFDNQVRLSRLALTEFAARVTAAATAMAILRKMIEEIRQIERSGYLSAAQVMSDQIGRLFTGPLVVVSMAADALGMSFNILGYTSKTFGDSLLTTSKLITSSIQNNLLSPLGYLSNDIQKVSADIRFAREDLRERGMNMLSRMNADETNETLWSMYQLQIKTMARQTYRDFIQDTRTIQQLQVMEMVAANTGMTVKELEKSTREARKQATDLVGLGALTREQGSRLQILMNQAKLYQTPGLESLISMFSQGAFQWNLVAMQNPEIVKLNALTSGAIQNLLESMERMVSTRQLDGKSAQEIAAIFHRELKRTGIDLNSTYAVTASNLSPEMKEMFNQLRVAQQRQMPVAAQPSWLERLFNTVGDIFTNIMPEKMLALFTAVSANTVALWANTAAHLGLGGVVGGWLKSAGSKVVGLGAGALRAVGLMAPAAAAVPTAATALGAAVPVATPVGAAAGAGLAAAGGAAAAGGILSRMTAGTWGQFARRMAIPVVGGAIGAVSTVSDAFSEENRQKSFLERLKTNVLNSAMTGASIGLIGGLPGALKGAIIGGLVGVGSTLLIPSSARAAEIEPSAVPELVPERRSEAMPADSLGALVERVDMMMSILERNNMGITRVGDSVDYGNAQRDQLIEIVRSTPGTALGIRARMPPRRADTVAFPIGSGSG